MKGITVASTLGPAVTTIDAEYLDTAVQIIPGAGIRTIRGFTIRNGFGTNAGGGINISGYALGLFGGVTRIENNVIVANLARQSGAGIYSFGASLELRGNTIRSNVGLSYGGGAGVDVSMFVPFGSATTDIDSNLIEGNVTAGPGAGLAVKADAGSRRVRVTISRNIIRTNCSGSVGAGLLLGIASAVVVNNVISDNRAVCGASAPDIGVGLYWGTGGVYDTVGYLVNNTIANNLGGVGSAVAIGGTKAQWLTVANNILSGGGTSLLHCESAPSVINNDVYPSDGAIGYSGACADQTGVNGNMSVDPLFVDATIQDSHLRPKSRLIDRGVATSFTPTIDIDGDPRPADGNGDGLARLDIGADEVHAAGAPSGVQRIITGAGTGGGPHVRALDSSGGCDGRFDTFAYAPEFSGGVTVASGDVDGDGVADVVTGAGPGGGPHVRVFTTALDNGVSSPRELASFYAYDAVFRGGVFVAVGDVTGDGVADIITGAGPGGGPHVRVFQLGMAAGASSGEAIVSEHTGFFAYAPAFIGGVRVAAGDLDGDGVREIITAAGPGGGPHVRAFRVSGDGAVMPVLSLFAYDAAFTGGVFVATGDVDGDGRDDIVTGADAGGGPHVRALAIGAGFSSLTELSTFYAYHPAFTGGVRVAAGDLDSDGRAEIITGAGPGGEPHVQIFQRAQDGALSVLSSFHAYAPVFGGGVFVAAAPR
jgi:hypothetical protein